MQILNSNTGICRNTYKITIALEVHTGIGIVDVLSTLLLSRSYLDFKCFARMTAHVTKVHPSR
jgi:hypothetical protein